MLCGYSKKSLFAELIVMISNKNLHSNKGIDYVETTNSFKDFSYSYEDLAKGSTKPGTNEVVLFRNSFQSSLKPSYVMYIANDSLKSRHEKATIESIRKEMQEAGLHVPLVIFDRYSIKEKMKQADEIEK